MPACGLIEDDPKEEDNISLLPTAPSFPLEVFPESIRNIIEVLNEYENYDIDFTAASFFTVVASVLGYAWSVRFMTGWVTRPIIFIVLVGSPNCGKIPPFGRVGDSF